MPKVNYEKVPGTWAYEMKNNWLAFNSVCDEMQDGYEKRVDRIIFREFVLKDMQERHEKEKKRIRKSPEPT
jgi:hypothetical protein